MLVFSVAYQSIFHSMHYKWLSIDFTHTFCKNNKEKTPEYDIYFLFAACGMVT